MSRFPTSGFPAVLMRLLAGCLLLAGATTLPAVDWVDAQFEQPQPPLDALSLQWSWTGDLRGRALRARLPDGVRVDMAAAPIGEAVAWQEGFEDGQQVWTTDVIDFAARAALSQATDGSGFVSALGSDRTSFSSTVPLVWSSDATQTMEGLRSLVTISAKPLPEAPTAIASEPVVAAAVAAQGGGGDELVMIANPGFNKGGGAGLVYDYESSKSPIFGTFTFDPDVDRIAVGVETCHEWSVGAEPPEIDTWSISLVYTVSPGLEGLARVYREGVLTTGGGPQTIIADYQKKRVFDRPDDDDSEDGFWEDVPISVTVPASCFEGDRRPAETFTRTTSVWVEDDDDDDDDDDSPEPEHIGWRVSQDFRTYLHIEPLQPTDPSRDRTVHLRLDNQPGNRKHPSDPVTKSLRIVDVELIQVPVAPTDETAQPSPEPTRIAGQYLPTRDFWGEVLRRDCFGEILVDRERVQEALYAHADRQAYYIALTDHHLGGIPAASSAGIQIHSNEQAARLRLTGTANSEEQRSGLHQALTDADPVDGRYWYGPFWILPASVENGYVPPQEIGRPRFSVRADPGDRLYVRYFPNGFPEPAPDETGRSHGTAVFPVLGVTLHGLRNPVLADSRTAPKLIQQDVLPTRIQEPQIVVDDIDIEQAAGSTSLTLSGSVFDSGLDSGQPKEDGGGFQIVEITAYLGEESQTVTLTHEAIADPIDRFVRNTPYESTFEIEMSDLQLPAGRYDLVLTTSANLHGRQGIHLAPVTIAPAAWPGETLAVE